MTLLNRISFASYYLPLVAALLILLASIPLLFVLGMAAPDKAADMLDQLHDYCDHKKAEVARHRERLSRKEAP